MIRVGPTTARVFDATDGFVANFDVEEHFVGDERAFSRKNDIGKEKECEKQKR